MLVNEWVETVWKVLSVRPRTLHDYKRLYRRHLEPVIGNVDISNVEPKLLQQKLLSLPPQTSRHTLMLAKTIWREAITYGLTETNPISAIQVAPKKFLTWEEVNTLDWGRYNEQIRFLALHGLRWSEATALNSTDIKDGFVWVNKTKYGPCKSKTSVRKIPYLGFYKPFPKSYKPMQLTANKNGVTVHSFRRTYAYLLKTQGIHVTTAQKFLGHSDPIMTLKIYTSVLDSEIGDAGEKLIQFISISGNKNIKNAVGTN
jgi:integrase